MTSENRTDRSGLTPGSVPVDAAAAVRRTPNPARDDGAGDAIPAACAGRGATNVASAEDHPNSTSETGRSDLWARLIHDLDRALNVGYDDDPETAAADQWYVDEFAVDCSTPTLLRVLARGLLAAGWRPPLPELRTVPSPWDAYREAYEAFQRENPAWRAHFTMHHMHALDAALRAFEVFDDGKCEACGRTYPETGDDVIVHFEGRPVVGRPISVQQGWEGDQFVELPRDFAVPAPTRATAEHDAEADAWYVKILDADVHHTTEDAPANLDWTRDGQLIGVELLGPLRQSAPDGWYPAAMREHDRANAAELDRSAAERRAASWWEAAKTLNRWGTAHRELHRKALIEIDRLKVVCKIAVGQRDRILGERDEARAKLDQVREVIAEDVSTRARFNVDVSTSYGPRFLNRIRAIVGEVQR